MRKTPTIQLTDDGLRYLVDHSTIVVLDKLDFAPDIGNRLWGHYTSSLDKSEHAFRDTDHLAHLLNDHFRLTVGRSYVVLENAYITKVHANTTYYCNMVDHRHRPRRVRYAVDCKILNDRGGVKLTGADDLPLWASRYKLRLTNWNVYRTDNLNMDEVIQTGITTDGFSPSWWNVWTDENQYRRQRLMGNYGLDPDEIVVLYYFEKEAE